mmetsp:Transcript_38749/g.95801  ORF Transcript_38749/g.95801 Transcript_38749/m.95801 type:complete len:243 (-) Transcript_38749:205-933(-)
MPRVPSLLVLLHSPLRLQSRSQKALPLPTSRPRHRPPASFWRCFAQKETRRRTGRSSVFGLNGSADGPELHLPPTRARIVGALHPRVFARASVSPEPAVGRGGPAALAALGPCRLSRTCGGKGRDGQWSASHRPPRQPPQPPPRKHPRPAAHRHAAPHGARCRHRCAAGCDSTGCWRDSIGSRHSGGGCHPSQRRLAHQGDSTGRDVGFGGRARSARVAGRLANASGRGSGDSDGCARVPAV